VADRGLVGVEKKAGNPLVVQARAAFVAGIVELPDRPGHVAAMFEAHAAVREADADVLQVDAGA
jgi:hypothetical protein